MTRPFLALLAASIIWGAAGPIIKFTLGGIAALPFLSYRFGLSSLIALFSTPWGGLKIPANPKIIATTVLYGLITSTITLGLLFLGLEKTTVLDATLISVVGPLMIVAAGAVFLKERVTRGEKIGISIALGGTVIGVLEPLLTQEAGAAALGGNLLIVAYLLSNTSSAVLAKRLVRQGVAPLALTNFSFIIGFLTITPLALLISKQPLAEVIANLAFPFHLGVIYMALLSGSLAYTLWARAQRTVDIGEAALFSYLYPIFSAPLAVFWLGETVTTPFVLGALVTAVGVFIAERRSS